MVADIGHLNIPSVPEPAALKCMNMPTIATFKEEGLETQPLADISHTIRFTAMFSRGQGTLARGKPSLPFCRAP